MGVRRGQWVSLHVHYGEDFDTLLLRGIMPVIRSYAEQDLIDGYFFIRYLERGPHLRVRVLCNANASPNVLQSELAGYLQAYLDENPSELTYAGILGHANFGIPLAAGFDGSDAVPNNTVIQVAYEPEHERYGGSEAMGASETLFMASSATAVRLIQSSQEDPRLRLIGGIAAGLLGVQTFLHDLDVACQFFTRYQASARDILQLDSHQYEEARQAMAATFEQNRDTFHLLLERIWLGQAQLDAIGLAPLHAWREALEEAREALTALGFAASRAPSSPFGLDPGKGEQPSLTSLCASHVHLTNNRLGISALGELYVAFILSSVLQHLTEKA